MRKSKTNLTKRKGNTTCSIIVDGDTEVWYFQLMKEYEKLRYDIDPKIPKKKSLKESFQTVTEHAGIYDWVYWIIDLDVIIKEHVETKKGEPSIIEDLKRYLKKCEGFKNVKVLINNPGLELWFLLHLENTSKYYRSCEDIIKLFRKYPILEKYEKSERYFKRGTNIYQKLKAFQPVAIQNSNRLGTFDIDNLTCAKCEMNKIMEDLLNLKP